jgi:hypothetical protein
MPRPLLSTRADRHFLALALGTAASFTGAELGVALISGAQHDPGGARIDPAVGAGARGLSAYSPRPEKARMSPR